MHANIRTHIRTYILISIHVFILFHTLYLQILIEMYTHAMRTSAYNFHPLFTYDTCPTSSFCSACLVMYIYIYSFVFRFVTKRCFYQYFLNIQRGRWSLSKEMKCINIPYLYVVLFHHMSSVLRIFNMQHTHSDVWWSWSPVKDLHWPTTFFRHFSIQVKYTFIYPNLARRSFTYTYKCLFINLFTLFTMNYFELYIHILRYWSYIFQR
jgi:hypothetical protein